MILTSWDIQVTGKSIFNCSSCPKYFHLIFLTQENYYCMFIFFPNIMKHKSQKQSVYKIIPWFPFLLRKWKKSLGLYRVQPPKTKKNERWAGRSTVSLPTWSSCILWMAACRSTRRQGGKFTAWHELRLHPRNWTYQKWHQMAIFTAGVTFSKAYHFGARLPPFVDSGVHKTLEVDYKDHKSAVLSHCISHCIYF